jgi:hypothetical protein
LRRRSNRDKITPPELPATKPVTVTAEDTDPFDNPIGAALSAATLHRRLERPEMEWIEVVNQNIQKRLAQSANRDREVALRSRPDLGVEIIVDGKAYQDLNEIDDLAIHDLIQGAMNEWQDEAAPTEPTHTASPTRRDPPFILSREWVIGLLIVMILVFVVPVLFVTSTHMALRLSFACTGAIIGGLIGIWGGRQFGKQVGHKVNNPGCMMSGQLFGALVGLILGLMIMAFLLNVLFPS